MLQKNPWEEDWTAPQGGADPITIGRPDQYKARASERDDERLDIAKTMADIAARNAAIAAQNANKPPPGYRFGPDGQSMEPVPGGPHDPRTKFRPLPDGPAKRLEEEVGTYAAMRRANRSFQDDFGGNTITGGFENTLQGLSSGIGTPGQRNWWAGFKTTDNQIRNSLFGATLTPSEQASYEQTSISERMAPAEIKKNLAQREQILREALSRKQRTLKANRFDPEAVDSYFLEFADDFADKSQQQRQEAEQQPLVQKNVIEGELPFGPKPEEGLSVDVTAEVKPGDPDYNRMRAAEDQRQAEEAQRMGIMRGTMNANPMLTGPNALFGNGATAGAAPMINGAVRGVGSALAGNGFTPGYQQGKYDLEKYLQQVRDESGVAGTVAEGGGMALGALGVGGAARGILGSSSRLAQAGNPFVRQLAGDTAYGAMQGFNTAQDGQGARGALTGAATAGGFNMLGTGAGKLIGGAIGGIRNEGARRLTDAGFPLTLGQMAAQGGMAGRAIKSTEDKLMSLPLVGDLIGARRTEGMEKFVEKTIDDALAPIGGGKFGAGTEAVQAAHQRISEAYTAALQPMRLQSDSGLANSFASIQRQAAMLPKPMQEVFDDVIQHANSFFGPKGELTGEGLQAIKQTLDSEASKLTGVPGSNGASRLLKETREALFEMAKRQDPDRFALYRKADDAFSRMMPVNNAAANAVNNSGVFSPAQFGTALKATDQSVRKTATAAGTRPQQDLQQIAQDILPSKTPDSGSYGRMALNTAALGAGGAATYMDANYAIPMAALALPATKMGRAMIQNTLVRRPDSFRAAGDALRRNAHLGGAGLSPLALQYLALTGQN